MRGVLTPQAGGDAAAAAAYTIPGSMHQDEDDYGTRVAGTVGNPDKQSISWWFRHDSAAPGNDIYWSTSGGAHYVANFDTTGYWYVNLGSSLHQESDEIADAEWHHFLIHYDSANATAADRLKAWIDGVEIDFDLLDQTITQNTDFPWPRAVGWQWGELTTSGGVGIVGKWAEVIWADDYLIPLEDVYDVATGLPPSGFSITNFTLGDEGFWMPFYIGPQWDGGGAATDDELLMKDQSGSQNDWVVQNSPEFSEDSPTQPFLVEEPIAAQTAAADYTHRNVIDVIDDIGSFNYIRILVEGPPSSGTNVVDNASVGTKATSGNAWDTDATPIEVLFNGASGFSLGAGEKLWSDWTEFTFDTADDLVVIFDSGSGATVSFSTAGALGDAYFAAPANSYNDATPAGLSTDASFTYHVAAVQVCNSDAPNECRTVYHERPTAGTAIGANYSLRFVSPVIDGDWTHIQISYRDALGGGYDADNVSVGIRTGSDSNTVDTPVEINFEGTSGMSVGYLENLISDVTAIDISDGDQLVIIVDAAASTGNATRLSSGQAGTECHFKTATDSYDQASVTGFTDNGTDLYMPPVSITLFNFDPTA